MMPRPPEFSQLRGFSYLMNCALHLGAGRRRRRRRPARRRQLFRSRYSGLRLPSAAIAQQIGRARSSMPTSRPSMVPKVYWRSIAISSVMTAPSVTDVGTSAWRLPPISAGSIIGVDDTFRRELSREALSPGRRARSAGRCAAAPRPCRRITGHAEVLPASVGKRAARPISVVTTGMPVSSASSRAARYHRE